jgi:hypothetical protein
MSLGASASQSGDAVAIDRILPGEEFLDGQRVPAARLFKREQPAANGGNYFGLAAGQPALRTRCREVGNCPWPFSNSGRGVKLSVKILAGSMVLSAVGACPPHDGVR